MLDESWKRNAAQEGEDRMEANNSTKESAEEEERKKETEAKEE